MSRAKSLRQVSAAAVSVPQQPEKERELDMPIVEYFKLIDAVGACHWGPAQLLLDRWPTILRRRTPVSGETLLEAFSKTPQLDIFCFLLGAGAAWRGSGGAAGTLPAILLRQHNLAALEALVEHAGPTVLNTGIPSRGNLMHIAIEEGAAQCFGYLLVAAPHLMDERLRADADNPQRKKTPPEFLEQWLDDAGSDSSDKRTPGVRQIRDMMAAWRSARAARSVLDELRAKSPTP